MYTCIYLEQARLDGAFCNYTEQEKCEYLQRLHKEGVCNIEMEATAFAALTHYAGIKAAIVCVTFLDRLKGDQVMSPKEVLQEWQMRPQILVSRFIKQFLSKMSANKVLPICSFGTNNVKNPRRFKLVQQESETYD